MIINMIFFLVGACVGAILGLFIAALLDMTRGDDDDQH